MEACGGQFIIRWHLDVFGSNNVIILPVVT